MSRPADSFVTRHYRKGQSVVQRGFVTVKRSGASQIQFWFVALLVGIGAGFAALGFRLGVDWLQSTLYQADDVYRLHSLVTSLEWYHIVLIPVLGGLTVGLILHFFTPDGRARSVADVIEGAALNDGRVLVRAGVASAAASFVTLSSGGSTGREGPVVHIAAVLSTVAARVIRADGITGRDLLGCAVAAAVSASFNTPIAGALFALEVVLRHFAVHSFAPIVIASVAGTVINRLAFGDVTEFVLPAQNALNFYVELPAFLLLGLLCGAIAVVLMKSIFWAEDFGNLVQARLRLPGYLRPALAGLLLGLIAVEFPQIIGVGYETTVRALSGDMTLSLAIMIAVVKVIAVSITMGGRMGGGVFSPALMVGALTGLAFGIIATSVFPNVSGEGSLYALAGMGAVAAAVLGAPISTALIVFELTGDWQTGLAVMVAVSTSTALSTNLVDRSFFLTQLERRNVHLAAGPQAYLLATFRVANVMRDRDAPQTASEDDCRDLIRTGVYIDGSATLEQAMPLFDTGNYPFIPVVTFADKDAPPDLVGALFHVDALKCMNRALAATAAEEHS